MKSAYFMAVELMQHKYFAGGCSSEDSMTESGKAGFGENGCDWPATGFTLGEKLSQQHCAYQVEVSHDSEQIRGEKLRQEGTLSYLYKAQYCPPAIDSDTRISDMVPT